VPAELTVATELSTALGALGYESVSTAPKSPPPQLQGVEYATWEIFSRSVQNHSVAAILTKAIENGRAFLESESALRRRVPAIIEWRGPTRTTGFELVPADLRIDHVYLVSCKYASNVLINASPTHLFEHLLQTRPQSKSHNWYQETAPLEFAELYRLTRIYVNNHLGNVHLPASFEALDNKDKRFLKTALSERRWPEELRGAYMSLCERVSKETAKRWNEQIKAHQRPELLLWRMLRISEAPYFVLGVSTRRHEQLRLRVGTPWDWNRFYRLRSFEVSPKSSGQPTVDWRAIISIKNSKEIREIAGHVEIRFSHGRFIQAPEAKVYLDTSHIEVPGYFPLNTDEYDLSPQTPHHRRQMSIFDL
jgi:hypothetical protein